MLAPVSRSSEPPERSPRTKQVEHRLTLRGSCGMKRLPRSFAQHIGSLGGITSIKSGLDTKLKIMFNYLSYLIPMLL